MMDLVFDICFILNQFMSKPGQGSKFPMVPIKYP
jgi:hypothetical protein